MRKHTVTGYHRLIADSALLEGWAREMMQAFVQDTMIMNNEGADSGC